MSAKVLGRLKQLLGQHANEDKNGIERELPFVALLFTLLAASGVTLYESWKKIANIGQLKVFQKEAKEVVRLVEVLGYDPLTVMQKRAEKTRSKIYREFLLGYVSAVRSGGSIVNYLRSKLRSIFEGHNAAAIRSIERLGTIVEAYAVMLIVTLCSYILFIVFSATSVFEPLKLTGTPSVPTEVIVILIFVLNPMISIVFMAIAHMERRSNIIGLKKPYQVAVISAAISCGIIASAFFTSALNFLTEPQHLPLFITLCLLIISLPAAVVYVESVRINYAAENFMPSFLRDVTEARKTGLSPEKSIIHAARRSGYGRFSEVLRIIRSQIEWGVPIKRVFMNVKRKIQTWPVLVNFLILGETIKTGGGSSIALDILTEYSEKMKDVETHKRAMLRPYVILAFIWSALLALTTTMVAMSVYTLTQLSIPGSETLPLRVIQEHLSLFSTGTLFQCWLSGFFIGKVSDGTFAAGFKYSIMLVLTAYMSLVISQTVLSGLFGLVTGSI
ncbi:type II secretion system F family protein [Candidatus Bathyarchaeota archaeon]|nr:type II secretion system F family protein [Candidatus Bathyarchaeota archaeon]